VNICLLIFNNPFNFLVMTSIGFGHFRAFLQTSVDSKYSTNKNCFSYSAKFKKNVVPIYMYRTLYHLSLVILKFEYKYNILTLMRMTKDEKGLAFFKGLLL
jgi:hypothetical protein